MPDAILIASAFGLAILCGVAPFAFSRYFLEENRGESR